MSRVFYLFLCKDLQLISGIFLTGRGQPRRFCQCCADRMQGGREGVGPLLYYTPLKAYCMLCIVAAGRSGIQQHSLLFAVKLFYTLILEVTILQLH